MNDIFSIFNSLDSVNILNGVFSSFIHQGITSHGSMLIKSKSTKKEYNEILDAVDSTIEYIEQAYNKTVSADIFFTLFNHPEYQSEIKLFNDGIRCPSIATIATIFHSLTKDLLFSIEETNDIIQTFYNKMLDNFLEDNYSANKLLAVFSKININKSSEIAFQVNSVIKKLKEYNNRLQRIERNTNKILISNKQIIDSNNQILDKISKIAINDALVDDDEDKDIKEIKNLFENGAIEIARSMYIELLKHTDENNIDRIWTLNSNIGFTYLNTFELTKAVLYFERAYQLKPNEIKSKVIKLYGLFINSPKEAIYYGENLLLMELNEYRPQVIQLLTQSHINNNSAENSLKYFTPQVLSTPFMLYNYSLALINCDKFKEAEIYLLKAIEIESKPELYDALSSCIISKIQKEIELDSTLLKDDLIIEELNDARGYSDEACKVYSKQQVNFLYATALIHRAVINQLLGELDNALKDYYLAESLDYKDELLYINRSLVYQKKYDYQKAIQDARIAYKINKRSFEILSVCLINVNQIIEAEAILIDNLDYPEINITESNCRYYLILAQIFDKKMMLDESYMILNSIEQIFPNNYELAIYKAELLWRNKSYDKAINLLKESISNNPDKLQQLEIRIADYYYHTQPPNYKQALKLYLKISDRDNSNLWDNNDLALERIVYCFYNLRQYNSLIQFVQSKTSHSVGMHINFNIIMANCYFELYNFEKARDLYKTFVPMGRDSINYINWAFAEFKLNNYSKAVEILERYIGSIENDFNALLQVAVVYKNIDRLDLSIDLLWKLHLKRPNDVSVLELFYHTVLFAPQESTTYDNLTIEQKELIRKIPDILTELDADNKFLTKIEIKDDNLDELLEMLKSKEKDESNLKQIFKSALIPISSLAQVANKRIFDTWGELIKDSSTLIVDQIIPQNTKAKHLRLLDTNKSIVIEPSTFYLLDFLNILEKVSQNFELYYPQYLLDELLEMKRESQFYTRNGGKRQSVASINGELVYEEISLEKLTKSTEHLEYLIKQVQSRVVGIAEIHDFNIYEKITDHIHISAIQTFLNSNNNSLVLSDEFSLKEYFSMNCNSGYISTRTLIHYLYLNRIISKSELKRLTYRMIGLGYSVFEFNAFTILQAIKDFDYNPNNYFFKAMIKRLKEMQINNYSKSTIFQIINQFLSFKSIQELDESKKNIIINTIENIIDSNS